MIGSGIASITTIIIYIVLALFVALALDPIVRVLERRGMKRGTGIGIVFGAFALLAVLFFVFVLPPILSQVGAFVRNLPRGDRRRRGLGLVPRTRRPICRTRSRPVSTRSRPRSHNPRRSPRSAAGALALGVGLVSAISAGFIVVALTLYFLSSLTRHEGRPLLARACPRPADAHRHDRAGHVPRSASRCSARSPSR